MEDQILAKKPEGNGPWDVVIIGSGPAGLTAAIYTTRGAASTLILGGSVWGGQLMLTTTVDNFPGFPQGVEGPSLMEKMKTQAIRFGGEFKPEDVTEVNFSVNPFVIKTASGTYTAKSIIVATGASTVWLDVPGVKEFIGKGISSCAPCDAPFFKDKKVAVVGGGDSAMEEALVLTKYTSEVIIIHRRDEFRASKLMQEKVLTNTKIKVYWNTEIVGVKGDSKVRTLSLKNNKTNTITDEAFDGMFVAIGHKPQTDIFKNLITTDEKGFIKNDGTKTNIPGVFVAGDVHDTQYKQAITAASFGCQAAMDTLNYLSEK